VNDNLDMEDRENVHPTKDLGEVYDEICKE